MDTKDTRADRIATILLAALVLGTLGFCTYAIVDSNREEIEHRAKHERQVMQAIPEGCTLLELGSYHYIQNLIIVTCNGKNTTSSNYTTQQKNNPQTTVIEVK